MVIPELLEYVVQGVFLGVIYGLIAIPLTLVHITTDSVDLAVGGYAVLSGVVAATVGGAAGILLGIGSAVTAASVVGIIYLLLSRRGVPDPITVVLATFGLGLGISSFVLWVFGQDPFVSRPFDRYWPVGGISINPQGVVNVGVAVILLVALYLALHRSSMGRSMRASAINPLGAGLVGIPVRTVQFVTFLVGGMITGVAGVLVLHTTGLDYNSGLQLGLLGIGAALLFGITSPVRAFFGGIALGVVEAVASGYISSGFGAVPPMLFILAMLAAGRLGRQSMAEARP